MVQCVNELPRLRDRSESMYRRLLVVPFEKRFEGNERKYIKDDYLYRPEVLEYVMHKLLAETDYYELDVPQACVDMLEEFKLENDPVRQFAEEAFTEAAWDLLRTSSCTTSTVIGSSATCLPVAPWAGTRSSSPSRDCPLSTGGWRRTRCAPMGAWISPSR